MKNSHQKTIDQSCAWLMQAFFVLLARHPYEAITITQIADQAQLSRRTFYRHFTAKDELLQKYLKMLLDRYAQLLLQKKSQGMKIPCNYSLPFGRTTQMSFSCCRPGDFLSACCRR